MYLEHCSVCSFNCAGSSNSYRLGNLKRPTYAPVPGLSSTTHVSQQNFAPFTPTQNPPVNTQGIDFTPISTGMSSFPGSPSSTGPYNSTTTSLNSGDSNHSQRPSMMSVSLRLKG